MKRKSLPLSIISLVVFIVGIMASLIFNTLVLWANLTGQSFWGSPEALTFDSSLTAEARLARLSCPIILSPGEVGEVNVKVSNPKDDPIEAWISAHISMPGEKENMVRETRPAPLAPGESMILRWEVSEDNIIQQRMILVRVFLRLSDLHPPARTKHCGVMMVDLWGLPSRTVTLLALVGGHVLQGVGIWMWWTGSPALGKRTHLTQNTLVALSIFSLVMSLGSVFHSWVFSMISLLLSILLVFTTLGYLFGMSDSSSG